MDRGERLDGFDFDDDLVFDDQIGAESGVDADIRKAASTISVAMAFSVIANPLWFSPSRQDAKNATAASDPVDSTGRQYG